MATKASATLVLIILHREAACFMGPHGYRACKLYKLGPAWPVRHSARSARAVEAAFRARLWGRAVFNFAADCVLGRWVTIYHHAYHTARAFRVPVPSAPVPSSRPLGRLAMQCARARQLSGRGRPRPTLRTRPTSTMARPCAGQAAPLLHLRSAVRLGGSGGGSEPRSPACDNLRA